MFIYENGIVVDYVPTAQHPAAVERMIREHMVNWANSLPGQSKVRLGKIGMMQGSEVNLKRLDNE